jgi:hypothetical protein
MVPYRGEVTICSEISGWTPWTYVRAPKHNRVMTTQHVESETALRAFIADVADEYRADADEWGEYEAATALYDDHDLCPWSITTHLESNVPYDELSGPEPRDMLVHEAYLCIESILTDIYTDTAD